MTDTGVARAIDALNRIKIPIELSKSLGWEKQKPLKIFMVDNQILLSAPKPGDVGILRKMDKLGRISLPMELCKKLSFSSRQVLQFACEGDIVYLIPVRRACQFCGTVGENLEYHMGIPVCSSCIRAIAQKRCG